MAILFGRTWYLSIGELDVSDLDLSFEVERSTKREPNKATINIRNLKPESRALLSGAQNSDARLAEINRDLAESIAFGANPLSRAAAASARVSAEGAVVLKIGYGDSPPLLFRGDTRSVFSLKQGPTIVTTIVARDGGRAYSEGRVARSYRPGTSIVTVLRDAVDAMEIGTGNLDDFLSSLQLRNRATAFAGGYVSAGPAHRIVSSILRGAGCRWSVQNGALQIQRAGNPIQSRATVIAADTGMIESPTWDETGQKTSGRRGLVSVRVKLQPGLEPGRKVRLESQLISGDFEVKKSVYRGDTRADDWDVTLDLRALSPVT